MKKLLSCFLLICFLAGCATMTTQTVIKDSMMTNEEKTTNIGDVFFSREQGTSVQSAIVGQVYGGEKFELTIVELTGQKLGLQYAEYYYQPPQAIGYSFLPGGWMIKQGFNKRFDYTVADKFVRFKEYEFEILGVENGQLRCRRLK